MPGEVEEFKYTDRLVVSEPRPTVSLSEFSEYDFPVSGSSVNLTLQGYVEDPIADNAPEGKVSEGRADIDSVQVYVDGSPVGAAQPVHRVAADTSSFWKQHPYKGEFDPITVTVPISEGTRVIRVQTSENVAGNTGYDEVTVSFFLQTVPGGTVGGGTTVTANIYFPADPTPEVSDSIQYYYGERDPETDDAVLSEDIEEPASLVFSGAFGETHTTISVGDLVGDTFTGTIEYSYANGYKTVLAVQFTETGPDTDLYRGTFSVGGGEAGQQQTVWMARVGNEAGSGAGTYVPLNMQVKVADDIADYRVALDEIDLECELEAHDGYCYLKGASITHIIVTRDPTDPTKYRVLTYDRATGRFAVKRLPATQLTGTLRNVVTNAQLVKRGATVLWADIDFTDFIKNHRLDDNGTADPRLEFRHF